MSIKSSLNNIWDLTFKLLPVYRDYKKKIKAQYYHNYPFFELKWKNYRPNNLNLKFTLDDMLFISALVREPVLLTGSSGSGKSYICQIFGEVLFGKNEVLEKTISSEMSIEDFVDIAFDKLLSGKVSLNEAIQSNSMLLRPMCILNEANRAPPIVQNVLFQILDNNLNVKSKHIPLGITVKNGRLSNFKVGGDSVLHNSFYFWNVLTVNEGSEFAGAQKMDRALLDRVTMEIEMDKYPPNFEDQIKMVEQPTKHYIGQNTRPNNIMLIYQAKNIIEKDILVSPYATGFSLMLGWLSLCDLPNIVNKKRVNFSPLICSENNCKYSKRKPQICPHSSSASNRIRRKLIIMAKSLICVKIIKTLDLILPQNLQNINLYQNELQKFQHQIKLQIELEDISKISLLILRSKIDLAPRWVREEYFGNKVEAVADIVKYINAQLKKFIELIFYPIDSEPIIYSRLDKAMQSEIQFKSFQEIIQNEKLPAKDKLSGFLKEIKNMGITLTAQQEGELKLAVEDDFRFIYLFYWAIFQIARKKGWIK